MSSIRTKILATLGPASTDPATLRAMVEAGCDMFRLNFSHGTPEQHGEALDTVRTVEADLNRPIAVLADLCGPKIRVGFVAGDGMRLGDRKSVV